MTFFIEILLQNGCWEKPGGGNLDNSVCARACKETMVYQESRSEMMTSDFLDFGAALWCVFLLLLMRTFRLFSTMALVSETL